MALAQIDRERMVEAFRSILGTLTDLKALKIASQAIGGEDAHRNRLGKGAVQKTVILLDKFRFLEEVLREDDNGNCPHCGREHRPYWDDFTELYSFLVEACKEDFDCDQCYDLGWIHVAKGDCRGSGESDNHYHIEKCAQCRKCADDGAALARHSHDCNCNYYRYDCSHYNDDSFDAHNHNDVPPMSRLGTAKLIKESEELMTEVKKAEINEKFTDVGVRFTGTNALPIITLPEEMDFDTAIFWLQKNRDELEKEVLIDHKFPGYYPPDAALALHKAIERTYGFVSQESRPQGWSIIPPETIGIQSDLDKIVQIPWGRMTFHGVGGFVQTNVAFVDGTPVMQLVGKIRKGDRDKIEKLVLLTKEILKAESIYRGKAITVDFSNFHPDDPKFDPMKAPKFMDLSKVTLDDLILSRNVYEMVETNLFVPIKHTAACRKGGIPLRRTVLLTGPYGTGKTLSAVVTAKMAVEHKWTYIYITDLKQLPEALKFAKNYEPAIIFGEDIDRVTAGERDEELDKYLNSLDGVDRKHDEVMVVFTTNKVDDIHPAMMRPGRVDAIIPINPPDATATVKLLYKYGRDLIDPNADLTKVSNMLAGQIPAVCREVVERSKLRAIRDAGDGEPVIRATHLEQAADEMLVHVAYINKPEYVDSSPMEELGDAIGNRIADAITNTDMGMINAVKRGGIGEVIETVVREELAKKNGKVNGSEATDQ